MMYTMSHVDYEGGLLLLFICKLYHSISLLCTSELRRKVAVLSLKGMMQAFVLLAENT